MGFKNKKTVIISIVVFVIYLFLQIFLAMHHEAWRDESQAWIIARNSSFTEMLGLCSSEGHPCLWFFVLKICGLCGISFYHLSVISISIMSLAAFLFLWKSPFSVFSKICILLSPIFFYYNPVVCRIYAIVVLLIVLLCICWPERRNHPILYGIIIALLFQSHILVAGLAIGCLLEILINYKELIRNKSNVIGLIVPVISFACMYVELRQSSETETYIQVNPEYCLSRLGASNITHSVYSVFGNICPGQYFIELLILITCVLMFTAFLFMCSIDLCFRKKAREVLIVSFCGVLCYLGIIILIRNSAHAQMSSVFWMLLLFFVWTEKTIPTSMCSESEIDESINDNSSSIRAAWKKYLRNNRIEVLFILCCILVIPKSALIDPIADVKGQYSGSLEIASMVEDAVPDDSVIVIRNDHLSTTIAAYLYDAEKNFVIWDIDNGCEYKVHKWGRENARTIPDEQISEEAREDWKGSDNVYFINGTESLEMQLFLSKNMTLIDKNENTNTCNEYYQLYRIEP